MSLINWSVKMLRWQRDILSAFKSAATIIKGSLLTDQMQIEVDAPCPTTRGFKSS